MMSTRLLRTTCALVLTLAAPQARAQEHAPLRVMTYNVRHVTSDDTGKHAWSQRQSSVMKTIQDNNPDIFGVQEASSAAINDALIASFKADYDRHQPSGGSPKTIFYRRARLERLSGDNAAGNIAIKNPYAESHACFSNAKGRTAAWVKLRDKQSQRTYIVVNAHVAHAAACGDARNEAAIAIHKLLDQQAGDHTIIVMGDLNSDPQRPSHQANDKIIELLETPQPKYTLRRSARHSGDTTASTATFNGGWKSSFSPTSRLDYIFVSIKDATTYRQSIDQRQINGISPSDHFPVLATIRHAPFAPSSTLDRREDTTAAASLAFADVDADGFADKLVWDAAVDGGRARLYRGDGQGKFGAASVVPLTTARGESILFGDVSGDGCVDRVGWGASVANGAVRVWLGACDGTFAAQPISGPGSTSATSKLSLARLNADACMDRVFWDPKRRSGQTLSALSACDGSFGADKANDDAGASANVDALVAFADVTGDGLDDKLVWDHLAQSGKTRLHPGTGDGTFGAAIVHSSGSSGVKESRFFYADINGDGHADKIFWRHSFRQGYAQLYYGRAAGFDAHPAMVNSGASASSARRFFFADTNGDAAADLITWSTSTPSDSRVYLALSSVPRMMPEPEPEPEPEPMEPMAPVDPIDPGEPQEPTPEAPLEEDEDPEQAEEEGLGAPPHEIEATGGCGCQTPSAAAPGMAWWLVAWLIGWRRRSGIRAS